MLSYPLPRDPKYYLLTQATSIKPNKRDSYDVVSHGLSSLHDYILPSPIALKMLRARQRATKLVRVALRIDAIPQTPTA